MTLRNYQESLVTKIKYEIVNRKRSICCVLVCGGG